MEQSFETRVFWSVTGLTVIAALLTVVVSIFAGLHQWAESLILFGSFSSMGWVGMIAYLASRENGAS